MTPPTNGNGYSLDKKAIEFRLDRLEQSNDRMAQEIIALGKIVEGQKVGMSYTAAAASVIISCVLTCFGTWMVAKWQMGAEAEQARAALIQVLKDNGIQPAGDHR